MFGLHLAQSPLTADDVLSPYVFVFYAAFIVSFLFTPIMKLVAGHYGIVDEPDQKRKLHATSVAYLGGVAVFLGWISGIAISQFLQLHRSEPGLLPHLHVKFSIVLGACVIIVLGLWDDLRGINPWVKIGGQVFAAVMLLVEGVGVNATASLLEPAAQALNDVFAWTTPGPDGKVTPEWLVTATSSALVVGLVVFCCNATNLMDGLDGLCGGVTAIIAAGFLFLAVHLAMFGMAMNSNNDALRVVLGLALLGAVLGFVPYNFNPASIFMGDTGSMFLGFACAVMIILLAQEQSKWFLAAMVTFALPILDTVLAFIRRWVNGRPIFSPDRFHFHHQLVGRGLTVRKTVILSYGLAIGFALLGVAIVYMRTRYAVAVYLVIFGSLIVAAYKMGMVHERSARAAAGQANTRRPAGEPGDDDAVPVEPAADDDVAPVGQDAQDDDDVAAAAPGAARPVPQRPVVRPALADDRAPDTEPATAG